jgi:periplasmic divalent cation tolerance protein
VKGEDTLAQLITTLSEEDQALELARAAVGERKAACVQVVGPITSVYRWEGEVQTEREFLCLMKVPTSELNDLVAYVRARHPYTTPELTTVAGPYVDGEYLAWVREEVRR